MSEKKIKCMSIRHEQMFAPPSVSENNATILGRFFSDRPTSIKCLKQNVTPPLTMHMQKNQLPSSM